MSERELTDPSPTLVQKIPSTDNERTVLRNSRNGGGFFKSSCSQYIYSMNKAGVRNVIRV